MKSNLIVPVVFSVLAGFSDLYAQSTLSPYSLFGIGEIDLGNHGANNGMAGLGIGFRAENTINSANPAALTALRSKVFAFDVSFSGKVAWYTGQGRKELSGTGNFDRLAIGFSPAKHWALSAGVLPVSTVGYAIRETTQVEGSNELLANRFSGEGGLSKIYLSTAIDLTRHLSLGITGSVIWGSITHTEQSDYWTTTNQAKSSGKPCFDVGLQYHRLFGDKLFFTAGVTAGYKASLSFHNTTQTSYNIDGELVVDKVKATTRQSVPEFYGAGFSFTTPKMVVGLDYQFQGWSGIESGSDVITYKNMNKWIAGLSYTPNFYDVRKYWRRITYQLGASVNDSYLRVSEASGLNYRVTCGMVFPVKNNMGSVYFGMEYGKNSFPVQNRHSIRENYFKFTIGFSLKDVWFIRYKFD